MSSTVDILRDNIADYIFDRLGAGIIDVELDKKHIDTAIDQSLRRYRQRSSGSVEESYLVLPIIKEQSDYILPEEVIQVRQVFRRGIGSVTGTTASQFEPFASGYLNTYMLVAGRVGGLASYDMFTQYQELAMRMFGGYINFTWNRVTKKISLIRKFATGDEEVILWTYNYKPEITLLSDFMIQPWIQAYSLALAKDMLGQAREKFATIAGPQGGTQLNGGALKAEAKEEMAALEEELKLYVDGSDPRAFVIG
jgi:hypothetical protein